MFISKATSVCCFVNLHHLEQLLTQICATKHALGSSRMLTELGHCLRNRVSKLCGSFSVVLCFSVTLQLSQLHLNMHYGAVSTSTCETARNSFFYASKSPKRRANSVRNALSRSAKCAFWNTIALTWLNITWQVGK